MKRTILATAAALTVAFAATTGAQASTIYVIDDFNHAAGDPFTTSLNKTGSTLPTYSQGPVTYSIGGNSFDRSILFSLVSDGSNAPNQVAKLMVGPTQLTVSNGSLVNSSLSLSYAIGSLKSTILAGGAGNTSTQFTVAFSDGTGNAGFGVGPTTIQAYLDNTTLGSVALNQVYDQTTAPGQISFTLLNGLIDGTDTLRFSFSGPTGYDLTINQIDLAIGSQVAGDVPEPAMLGLFGMGVLGLGIARRRKR